MSIVIIHWRVLSPVSQLHMMRKEDITSVRLPEDLVNASSYLESLSHLYAGLTSIVYEQQAAEDKHQGLYMEIEHL